MQYPERLFRGVDLDRYNVDQGLMPRNPGAAFSSEAQCGDLHAVCGSGVVCGNCDTNSVVAHQWNGTGAFPEGTSGLSTTPHFRRALFYALADGKYREGRILEFDTNALIRAGVQLNSVPANVPVPAVPEDEEFTLVASDHGVIPASAVVRVHCVLRDPVAPSMG